jgi:hypothetical protein
LRLLLVYATSTFFDFSAFSHLKLCFSLIQERVICFNHFGTEFIVTISILKVIISSKRKKWVRRGRCINKQKKEKEAHTKK